MTATYVVMIQTVLIEKMRDMNDKGYVWTGMTDLWLNKIDIRIQMLCNFLF